MYAIRSYYDYAVALATQCNLYRKYTADSTFTDMENSLTDWLFGCNPWGISMVVDLPETGLTPKDPRITSYNVCYTKLLRPIRDAV